MVVQDLDRPLAVDPRASVQSYQCGGHTAAMVSITGRLWHGYMQAERETDEAQGRHLKQEIGPYLHIV